MSATTHIATDQHGRVEEVTELIGRHADQLAAADRLPEEIVRASLAGGLYRMCLPAELGGARMPLPESVAVIERLSYADGSVGWCTAVANVGASLLARIDEAQARLIAATPETLCIAGGFPASGRGTPTGDGGVRVSGRWSFASGAHAANWLLGGMIVAPSDPADPPRWLVGFFPADHARIVPNWDVIGLRATGSHDLVAEDVPVPAGRMTPLLGGPCWSSDPIAAVPFFALGPLLGAVPLGIARRALDELTTLAIGKTRFGQPQPFGLDQAFQDGLSSALSRLGAARSYLRGQAAEVWRAALAGAVTPRVQASTMLAVGEAGNAALAAVRFAHHAAGTASLRTDSPLTRCRGDVLVATRHVAFSSFAQRDAARLHLGLPTERI